MNNLNAIFFTLQTNNLICAISHQGMLLLTIAVSIVFTKALCTLKSSHSLDEVWQAPWKPPVVLFYVRDSN